VGSLLSPVTPALPSVIDIRCADARDVEWPDADLVLTDPPWVYRLNHTESYSGPMPNDIYAGLSCVEIAAILGALVAPRMAMWATWPLLAEWSQATENWAAWGRPTTGGAWVKSGPGDSGHYGPGFHWAGCSEFVLVYTCGGGHCDRSAPLRNAWIEPPRQHSRKPVEWQAQMIRRWVPAGGLVLDPFAGLGSVAEAVLLAGEGRRYMGTEIDPERHTAATALIAQARRA
jgi:N6-adenosine-specific RNA methylase IME4